VCNVLPMSARVSVANQLVEGTSIRATVRLTGVAKATVMRFGIELGEGCVRLHDRLVRNVEPTEIQMDEIWGFITKKEARVDPVRDPAEWGDTYTWVALDPHSKLVISYLTGKRDGEHAKRFTLDLRSRILTRARVQMTSDGLAAYVDAVEAAFGRYAVDYGQVVKNYRGGDRRPDRRYEVGKEQDFITKTRIFGKPREEAMSTSLVERQNLTMRMHVRRLTRMTNAYSKKLRPMSAAIALHFMFYNFCRIHETIRVTPAMEAGLTDHVWDIAEMVERALAEPMPAPAPPSPVPPPPPGGPIYDGVQLDLFGEPTAAPMRPALRLIQGGKACAANEIGEEEEAPDTVRGMGWAHLKEGSEGVG
jgi:IS1 family transposase